MKTIGPLLSIVLIAGLLPSMRVVAQGTPGPSPSSSHPETLTRAATGAAVTSATWSGFANLSSPIGVFTDSSSNVFVTSDYPDVLNPHSLVAKFDSSGSLLASTFLGNGLFADEFTGHIAQDPTTGEIWDVDSLGNVYLIHSDTSWTFQFNIAQLQIDTSNIFDIQSRTSSGGWIVTTDSGNTEYRDIALLRRGSQLDVFITGRYVSFNFVLRLRYNSGTLSSASVILGSKQGWCDYPCISPITTEPRGIAVNSQGTVLTTLPIQLSGDLEPTDHLVKFSADFPTNNAVTLYSGEFTSHGMGTDAAGNFYVATGTLGVAACGSLTSGALVVLDAAVSTYSCDLLASTAGVDINSQDVAPDAAGDTAYMTIVNQSPSVIRWSLPPPPAPAVSLAPTSLTFGNQPVGTTSSGQTVTLTNTGTAGLTVSAVGIGGTNAGDFGDSTNCSGATVAPGNSCTATVTFSPSGTGTRSAALRFTDSASDSPQSVSLTGTGVAAPTSTPRPSPTATFTAVPPTRTSTPTLTVTAVPPTSTPTITRTGTAVPTSTLQASNTPVSTVTLTTTPVPTTTGTPPTGTVQTASTAQQYTLAGSDGNTWIPMDGTNLTQTITPTTASTAILSGNSDLWTSSAGYNQDIGIWVAGGAYGSGQVVAWKESGGFAGTFSPNAAYVHTVLPLSANTTYTVTLVWKSNRPDPGTIWAGAGPISGNFSPTRLTTELIPAPSSTTAPSAVSTQQYTLTGSDGSTWVAIDGTNLSTTITPSSTSAAVLSGNSDLWTSSAGYNQDIGIWVAGGTYGSGQVVAWKESGGFAGTFSPNAAFVQTVLSLQGGTTYQIKLVWKANKPDPGTIWAGAGPIGGNFSPTRLTAELIPSTLSTTVSSAASTQQYTLANSDGSTWMPVDGTTLSQTITPTANVTALLSGNSDLWTSSAGYNQDIGIWVSGGTYGSGQVVAWKESGGFAGTFSPNAAFVQTVLSLQGNTTYTIKLVWKANKADPGTIWAGAGPINGNFSPTRLTAELLP